MRTPAQLIKETQFVTYHSANAASHETWIAYPIVNGEQWLVRSCGTTEKQAVDKARALWIASVNKQAGVVGTPKFLRDDIPDASDPDAPDDVEPTKVVRRIPGASETGRGKGFIGTTWLVRRDKKGVVVERGRIPNAKVASHMANGWERGGPRTK